MSTNADMNPVWEALEGIARGAPADLLARVSAVLRAAGVDQSADAVAGQLPATPNSDMHFALGALLRQVEGRMSWDALGWSLEAVATTVRRQAAAHQDELLWSGPLPQGQVPARRIDQVLYDLIADAKSDILLVTFAAAKIQRLTTALTQAASRGVAIRLVLEFEETSAGQLTYDALKAFPKSLTDHAEICYWPLNMRERNQAGRPGKLHAKVAVIDDVAVVSSANLTDDAFNRNLEMGVKLVAGNLPGSLRKTVQGLLDEGILRHWTPHHGSSA